MENLFKINNLRYDSGNIKTLINQNWQITGNIETSDKFISLVIFNFNGDKANNYTFHIDNLKLDNGFYFLVNSTPNFGYTGGYIRIMDGTVQIKCTSDSSHKFYLRSLQIYN